MGNAFRKTSVGALWAIVHHKVSQAHSRTPPSPHGTRPKMVGYLHRIAPHRWWWRRRRSGRPSSSAITIRPTPAHTIKLESVVVSPVRQHTLIFTSVVPVGLLNARHRAADFGVAVLHVIRDRGAQVISLRSTAEMIPERFHAVGP